MEMQKTNTKRTARLVTLAIVALIAGVTASWLLSHAPDDKAQALKLQAGTALIGQTRPLPPFTLLDQKGQPFGNERLNGKWSFIFFGYTHCPDVCPTTMSTLNEAMGNITQNGDEQNTQVLFISVDPERDKLEQLDGYVKYFNPDFIGLTGTPAALNGLTMDLGILHLKVPNPNDPDNYLVDHSASILLVDPQGHLLALFGAPHQASLLADDFHTLRQYLDQG
jgi:protein SCO1/2